MKKLLTHLPCDGMMCRLSTHSEDVAYMTACESLGVVAQDTWRETRRAAAQDAIPERGELLVASLPDLVDEEKTQAQLDAERQAELARQTETVTIERRDKYRPTIARFRDPNLKVTQDLICTFEFKDARCTYDKKNGDLHFCSMCRIMVDDPLLVPLKAKTRYFAWLETGENQCLVSGQRAVKATPSGRQISQEAPGSQQGLTGPTLGQT